MNLNFDRYEYYYDGKKIYGNSRVKLHCLIKEGKTPIIRPFKNRIRKIGIEQHPVDLSNTDDLIWLQALVWPDQTERFLQLKEAVNTPGLSEIRLIKGSTIEDFKKVIEVVDPVELLIISATHVLYQFRDQFLLEFFDLLASIAQKRDFYFLSAEATEGVRLKYGTGNTAVVLTTYKNRQRQETLVAETNGHGTWLKWS